MAQHYNRVRMTRKSYFSEHSRVGVQKCEFSTRPHFRQYYQPDSVSRDFWEQF